MERKQTKLSLDVNWCQLIIIAFSYETRSQIVTTNDIRIIVWCYVSVHTLHPAMIPGRHPLSLKKVDITTLRKSFLVLMEIAPPTGPMFISKIIKIWGYGCTTFCGGPVLTMCDGFYNNALYWITKFPFYPIINWNIRQIFCSFKLFFSGLNRLICWRRRP